MQFRYLKGRQASREEMAASLLTENAYCRGKHGPWVLFCREILCLVANTGAVGAPLSQEEISHGFKLQVPLTKADKTSTASP